MCGGTDASEDGTTTSTNERLVLDLTLALVPSQSFWRRFDSVSEELEFGKLALGDVEEVLHFWHLLSV